MKRPLSIFLYSVMALGIFYLNTKLDFPLPTPPPTETVESETVQPIPSEPVINIPFYTCTILGIPYKDRYSDSELVSRNPWDITVFDNKVFVGCGDYDKNTGPCDIMFYDLEKEVWVNSGTVNDESIANFFEINGKLIAPGTDPKEDFSFANYYVYGPNGWETVRRVPDGAHMFDIEVYNNETFYAIGTSNITQSPVQKTTDGKTFTAVQFNKNGKPISENSTDSFSRCYALFTLNNKLYAFCRWSKSGYYGFFEYDGDSFNLCSENPYFDTQQGINRQSLLNGHATYNGKSYLSLGTFVSTSDFKEFSKIATPENSYVQDIVTKNGKMFLLTSQKIENPKNPSSTHLNTVWEYTEETGFKEILSFEHSTTAMSFDITPNAVYVGVGNYSNPTDQNGLILEFKLN